MAARPPARPENSLAAVNVYREAEVIGEIFGHNLTGWDPSVCKCNRLHVHILRFSFIKLGVYSTIYSIMIGIFPPVLNFAWLLLKLNRFICN